MGDLADGRSHQDIVANYPNITEDDIRGTAFEGSDDADVFAKAQEYEAVLLTTDRKVYSARR